MKLPAFSLLLIFNGGRPLDSGGGGGGATLTGKDGW